MPSYFHIDLDAFFASAELLDNPDLKGKPVIVGAADSPRGVVSTCSYEARAFGVHSAMPIREARRLCPKAVFMPVRMARYSELSQEVMAVFAKFTPDIIQVSIDEASLDMSGTERLWGPAREAAEAIRQDVRERVGLSISIGAASNRYVAKIASGLRKPNGLFVVDPGEESTFMQELPLDKLWGAGPKTRERLRELGIHDMPHLLALSKDTLSMIFGTAGGNFLYQTSRGQDPGIYGQEAKSRSLSTETTFNTDVRDRETLESVLLGMADELAERMYQGGHASRTAVLKLRDENFDTITVRDTKPGPFIGSAGIYAAALELLERKWDGRPVRLIGLALANLGDPDLGQGRLFEDEGERSERRSAAVERAVFEAGKKGLGKITRARFVKPRKSDEPTN